MKFHQHTAKIFQKASGTAQDLSTSIVNQEASFLISKALTEKKLISVKIWILQILGCWNLIRDGRQRTFMAWNT